MNETAITKQAVLKSECYEQVIVDAEDAVKKRRKNWQFSHVEAFSRAVQHQTENQGIQQYSETVKSCSVRIPLMINIPGETLRYSLFRVF